MRTLSAANRSNNERLSLSLFYCLLTLSQLTIGVSAVETTKTGAYLSILPTWSSLRSSLHRGYRTQHLLSSPTNIERERTIYRPLILVDDATGEVLAQGCEFNAFPERKRQTR